MKDMRASALAGLLVMGIVFVVGCKSNGTDRLTGGGQSSVQKYQGGEWVGELDGQPASFAMWKNGDHLLFRITINGVTQETRGLDGGEIITLNLSNPSRSYDLRKAGDRLDVISGGTGFFEFN